MTRQLDVAQEMFLGAKLNDAAATDPKVVGLTLLARTYSNLKGVLLLSDAGRVIEARTLARCCFENAFYVARLLKEGEAFLSSMVEDEVGRRKARANIIFKEQLELEAEKEERLRQWLRENRQLGNQKALNPKEVAELGDLWGAYILYAQLSSAAAHPSLEALSQYFQDEGVLVMEPRVSDKQLCLALGEASMAMISTLIGVNDLLRGTEVGSQLDSIVSEYKKLLPLGSCD